MVSISDIFPINDLEKEILAGYVNRRFHPEFPNLAIVGYSEKTAYEDHWNDVTLTCRGLIYDMDSLEVLARPFPKFFNWGDERHVVDVDLEARPYFVSDKFDGSLGIVYREPTGRLAVATRGSFESDQAIHATKLLRSREDMYKSAEWMTGNGKQTPLFEIVYPENRIVLDYGDLDALFTLGAVNIATGSYVLWGGDGTFDFRTIREVLEAPPRENAEGYVIWLDRFTAVKLKQDDYVALHKIVTGLNRKAVWRALMEGTFAELIEQLPDEFYKWADEVANELGTTFNNVKEYAELMAIWADKIGDNRKDQALWIQASVRPECRGYVFGLLDGKDIDQAIWKKLEPVGGER